MSGKVRAISGFFFGFVILVAAVQVFTVNAFDHENMRRGVELLLSGVNPWAVETRIPHFYNPPFALIFLWPLLFLPPQGMIVLGGALLCGFIFQNKAWVALAWFLTNSALYVIAAGGVDMYLVGGGVVLLTAGDAWYDRWIGLLLRVLGYGMLLVKPQGTIFIVLLYILLRRDWRGMLSSLVLYGLPFLRLYPDWLRVLLTDPPLAQTVAAHTIWRKFGPMFALLVAVLILFARRWRYWELGGALAGILSPYGMPGVPILLSLGASKKLVAVPIVILFSAGLAHLTWVTPPPDVDFYAYLNPLMSIYHLVMLALALVLAVISPPHEETDPKLTVNACLFLRHLRFLDAINFPKKA